MDFSKTNQRLVFQANYEEIEVVPILHRNTIAHIGMKQKTEYLATKVIDGLIITLSLKGKLYTWDLLSGKPLQNKAVSDKSFRDYEVYRWGDEDEVYLKEWYGKVLLKKKLPIENYNEAEFFGFHLENHIKGQVSYVKKLPKQFYEFRLIEIMSDKQVKDHLKFIHPVYNGNKQFIYISSDLTFLYERLKYERHFLYTRMPNKTDNPDDQFHWKMVHRFK